MTIKVEQEALLCVLSRPPSHPPSPSAASGEISIAYDGEEMVDVSCPKDQPCVFVPLGGDNDFLRTLLRRAPVEKCESFDDDCSVTTASSSSSSSLDEKRVSFADPIVTDVFTRPRTLRHEIPRLFYSYEETQRFRQEYRLERKLLAELDVDPETHPVDDGELSALVAGSCNPASTQRHRISRVVVLHNDKLETFLSPDVVLQEKPVPDCDAFFDNDSFWSGSITWY